MSDSAAPLREAPPRFVVLDGIDGCGKTSQAERLVERLAAAGRPRPLHVREPGSTAAGERIRALLLDPDVALEAQSEVLLFAAARRQMLAELVQPALADGRDVVCERFHPSTFAYQAVAGGLDEDAVLELLSRWCGAPVPDRIVLFALDPAEALARRGEGNDRFEGRGLAFQERVAAGYRRFAERVPGVAVVDAAAPPERVADAVWDAVWSEAEAR